MLRYKGTLLLLLLSLYLLLLGQAFFSDFERLCFSDSRIRYIIELVPIDHLLPISSNLDGSRLVPLQSLPIEVLDHLIWVVEGLLTLQLGEELSGLPQLLLQVFAVELLIHWLRLFVRWIDYSLGPQLLPVGLLLGTLHLLVVDLGADTDNVYFGRLGSDVAFELLVLHLVFVLVAHLVH